MTVKINTQVDGKSVEIEVPDEDIVAAGFQQTATFEKELTRRGVSIAQKQGFVKPDELTAEQVKELAERKGVKLPAELPSAGETATQIQEAVTKKRAEWEQRELAPLNKRVEELSAAEEDLLQKQLHSAIITAAAQAGIDKTLLKPLTKSSLPPIVSMLESSFAYDTETKQFYVLSDDGEGFAFSDHPTQDHPLKDVEEFIEQWVANKENQKFVEPQSQRGPGLQGTLSGARGGPGAPVHISKEDSRNLRKLEAAKAEAKKRGLDPYEGVVIDG